MGWLWWVVAPHFCRRVGSLRILRCGPRRAGVGMWACASLVGVRVERNVVVRRGGALGLIFVWATISGAHALLLHAKDRAKSAAEGTNDMLSL